MSSAGPLSCRQLRCLHLTRGALSPRWKIRRRCPSSCGQDRETRNWRIRGLSSLARLALPLRHHGYLSRTAARGPLCPGGAISELDSSCGLAAAHSSNRQYSGACSSFSARQSDDRAAVRHRGHLAGDRHSSKTACQCRLPPLSMLFPPLWRWSGPSSRRPSPPLRYFEGDDDATTLKGGFEVKFKEAAESAERALTAADAGRDRVIEAELSRLLGEVGNADQPATDRLAARIAELLREDRPPVQTAEQRTDLIVPAEYHAQGLAQSKLAFLCSLVFAALGFLLIAASVVVVLAGRKIDAGIVTLVSGAVVEAVSGLFFVQANRARNLMAQFFDKLRIDRSLDEALRMSQAIPDPLIRSRLRSCCLRLA